MSKYSEDDPYLDRHTGVLFNLLDSTDQDTLDRVEADVVSFRMSQLDVRPVTGQFDVEHLRAVHRHLFGDVYRWAGEFRIVGISKGSSHFCAPAHIESYSRRRAHGVL